MLDPLRSPSPERCLQLLHNSVDRLLLQNPQLPLQQRNLPLMRRKCLSKATQHRRLCSLIIRQQNCNSRNCNIHNNSWELCRSFNLHSHRWRINTPKTHNPRVEERARSSVAHQPNRMLSSYFLDLTAFLHGSNCWLNHRIFAFG